MNSWKQTLMTVIWVGLSGRRLSSFPPLLCRLSSLMVAGLDKLFLLFFFFNYFLILGTLQQSC